MGKNFSIFFLIAAAVICILMSGCTKNEAAAEPIVTVTAEEEIAPQETQDKTAELKEIAYQNFEGKTESDIAGEDHIDFAKLFALAGLEYDVTGHEIEARPIGYNPEEDFLVQIHFDPEYHIVTGSTIYTGRQADGTWAKNEINESATDFIFDAKLDDQKYRIGVDELDYLWREVRLLTAPADKIDAVNEAVDAEFESYYVDTLPEE